MEERCGGGEVGTVDRVVDFLVFKGGTAFIVEALGEKDYVCEGVVDC